MPALTLKGNDTGVAADPQDLTVTEVQTLLNVEDGANNYVHPNHSGDVTSVADGATTIQPDVVDNTKLANMPALTIKGNDTGAAGDPQDLTVAEAQALLGIGTKLSWQFAAARRANSVTNSYMRMEDGQFMNIAPLIVPVTGKLKAVTVASQVNETWTAEVRRAPAGSTTFSVIASLNISFLRKWHWH
jgi:hypothetical protein